MCIYVHAGRDILHADEVSHCIRIAYEVQLSEDTAYILMRYVYTHVHICITLDLHTFVKLSMYHEGRTLLAADPLVWSETTSQTLWNVAKVTSWSCGLKHKHSCC